MTKYRVREIKKRNKKYKPCKFVPRTLFSFSIITAIVGFLILSQIDVKDNIVVDAKFELKDEIELRTTDTDRFGLKELVKEGF